jgi:type II secretory pathway pseudopilin PulG
MITQPHPLPTTNAPQEGFVLIVGLVILGLLTMLALSSMRDTTMQEKMAGASRDSGLAFQAAESALRDAENCITGTTAGCTFDAANDAHFTRDDKEFPGHNTLFNATTWDAYDPPGEPTPPGGSSLHSERRCRRRGQLHRPLSRHPGKRRDCDQHVW